MRAIVKQTGDPDGLGRVRISLPSLGPTDSIWAPVVQPFGASGAAEPKVGDEVLVIFEREDVRFP